MLPGPVSPLPNLGFDSVGIGDAEQIRRFVRSVTLQENFGADEARKEWDVELPGRPAILVGQFSGLQ